MKKLLCIILLMVSLQTLMAYDEIALATALEALHKQLVNRDQKVVVPKQEISCERPTNGCVMTSQDSKYADLKRQNVRQERQLLRRDDDDASIVKDESLDLVRDLFTSTMLSNAQLQQSKETTISGIAEYGDWDMCSDDDSEDSWVHFENRDDKK